MRNEHIICTTHSVCALYVFFFIYLQDFFLPGNLIFQSTCFMVLVLLEYLSTKMLIRISLSFKSTYCSLLYQNTCPQNYLLFYQSMYPFIDLP